MLTSLNNRNHRLGALLGCVSAAVLMAASPATAQDSSAQNNQGDQVIDEVISTGFRASQREARDLKRNAKGIIDAIIAEDIGKMPDENVAEALQRITGISITRESGEGSKVSVRGMAPELNRITINGKTLTSGEDEQSVGLESLSAGLLAGVEVVKTPSADMIEGSLGGTINLKTRRPLDVNGRKIIVSAQGSYSDLADKLDPKGSLTYINQFNEGKIGVAASLTYEDRYLRQDGVEFFGYNMPDDVTGNRNTNPSSLRDADGTLLPGHPDRILPDGTDLGPTGAAVLRNTNPRIYFEDRKRIGGTLALEFQPNDTTHIILDGSYSKLDVDRARYQYIARYRNNASIVPDSIVVNENNTVVSAVFDNTSNGRRPFAISNNRWQQIETETFVLGGELNKEIGRWDVSAKLGYSKATQEIPQDIRFIYNNGANRFALGYDISNSLIPIITVPGGQDLQDPSIYRFSQLRKNERTVTDDEVSAQLDFDREINFGFFNTLEFGGRYTDRSKDRLANTQLFTDTTGFNRSFTLADVQAEWPVDDYMSSIDGDILRMWPIASLEGSLAQFGIDEANIDIPEDPLQTYTIKEETLAGYVMADFESANGRISGDIGVRVVNTKTMSNGFANQGGGPEAVSFEKSYTKALPSLNVRYAATDNIILRFAVGRVMARPQFDKVAPRLIIDPTQLSVRGGNPDLNPFVADQLDLAAAYYWDDKGMISVGVYYKDITDFIVDSAIVSTFINPDTGSCYLDIGSTECALFNIRRPLNGDAAKVKGVELNFYRDFDFLPSFLTHTGLQANYTYSDSTANVVDPATGTVLDVDLPLPGLSKHTFNTTGYYEDDKLSLRVSYNRRSKYLRTPFGGAGNTEYVFPYEQFDFSSSYKITDSVKLIFQIQNLTNSVKKGYSDQFAQWEQLGTEERLRFLNIDGRKIRVGFTANF